MMKIPKIKIDSGKVVLALGALVSLGGLIHGQLQSKEMDKNINEQIDKRIEERLSLINKEEA